MDVGISEKCDVEKVFDLSPGEVGEEEVKSIERDVEMMVLGDVEGQKEMLMMNQVGRCRR